MQQTYFEDVVNALSFSEISLLSLLYDNDATLLAYRSMQSKELQRLAGLSDCVYRSTLSRLRICKLVDVVQNKKQFGIYVTGYGVQAIQKSLEEAGA